jgi:hypothetical protein
MRKPIAPSCRATEEEGPVAVPGHELRMNFTLALLGISEPPSPPSLDLNAPSQLRKKKMFVESKDTEFERKISSYRKLAWSEQALVVPRLDPPFRGKA